MTNEIEILETLKNGTELVTLLEFINIYDYTDPKSIIPPGYMDIVFDNDDFKDINISFQIFQEKILTLVKYEKTCIGNESYELAAALKLVRESLFVDTYAHKFSHGTYLLDYYKCTLYLNMICEEIASMKLNGIKYKIKPMWDLERFSEMIFSK